MPVVFQTQLTSWVLVTPAAVPGLVIHQRVIAAAGGQPTSVVQLGDIAVADFRNLQVSYVERSPERYNLSVTERGAAVPSERLTNVASAAFRIALETQQMVAVGMNVMRQGLVTGETAGAMLLRLLGDTARTLGEALGEAGEQPLSGAGVKVFYNRDPWRVTLTVEPDAQSPQQVLANVNYHAEYGQGQNPRALVDELIDQGPALYTAFVQVLDRVLMGEVVHAGAR